MTTPALDLATAAFARVLGEARSAAVAFSGGVDSTLTAALTARVLGRENVVALLGVSPSLAGAERAQAASTAEAVGLQLVEVATYEIDDERYVANRGDRCYFCKHELYTRAFADAAAGHDVLVNGDTADDHLRGDRPGRRAAVELGVRSPLAEAGIGKAQVRALGVRELRVRHLGAGARVELGPDDLARVRGADVEQAVRAAGYADVTLADEPLRRD